MTTTSLAPASGGLLDEHSVLVRQTCAYADDLSAAARSGRSITAAHEAMLEFLHYRLLPYLSDEERHLPSARLRDEHLARLVLTDHARLRDDVENIESSRTRRLLTLATDALVDRLDRHIRREQAWVDDTVTSADTDIGEWALPLLLGNEIDFDALPPEQAETLLLRRLQQMRPGDEVALHASRDLHPLWRRHHLRSPDSHVWVYDQQGPTDWRARIARRATDDG